jgi:hypothetical protein
VFALIPDGDLDLKETDLGGSRNWKTAGDGDGDGSRQWSTVLIKRWGTSSAVALSEMKDGWRWRTTVAGSCETGRRNQKNDGAPNGGG